MADLQAGWEGANSIEFHQISMVVVVTSIVQVLQIRESLNQANDIIFTIISCDEMLNADREGGLEMIGLDNDW